MPDAGIASGGGVGAVINRLGIYGPPDSGHRVSAPAGGLVQPGCTPHFSFVLPKEKRAVHGPKEKGAKRAPVQWPSARDGVGVSVPAPILPGLRARLGLLRGRYCRPVAGVPTSSGCKDAFEQLPFPRVPLRYALPRRAQKLLRWPMLQLSSTTGQRQRKAAQDVSLTSPGRRFPQGPGVSVPDFCKGVPAIPRRRQEVCAGADRPAEHFFFSTGRGAFSF